MPTSFHNKVSLQGFHFEDSLFTFKLANGITKADEGKAVAFGAAANTVKLVGDGDAIIGRLEVVEDRKVEGQLVGTVALRFINTLPKGAGETITIGQSVCGDGTAGAVRAKVVADDDYGKYNIVVEVLATEVVVAQV
ncbi:hypothetical protein IZ6_25220 [Terrihabitans soli]|uniref:DUF2190 family protein n=1 Tax=Terrihabitans soli TaxID=708113 RepID=A0A6S6QV40_9HYPH|nr:hypothetical protein [Terrihabitans soli]BCJ91787.1 hypothetical protein IZ6_25220 [Terrihabitans soli]